LAKAARLKRLFDQVSQASTWVLDVEECLKDDTLHHDDLSGMGNFHLYSAQSFMQLATVNITALYNILEPLTKEKPSAQ
jgi:hypothetical protein